METDKPISKKGALRSQEAMIAFDTGNRLEIEKKKAAKKLHRQFGHP